MQGNNQMRCTFLCLHSLTAVIGSPAFEALRNPLKVTAFPDGTCLPRVAIPLIPQPVSLLTGSVLPSSFLSRLHVPEILLKFAQVIVLYGFQGSYMVFLNHLSGTSTFWTPDSSQATLECISHKPQVFVILLFQSISQCTSLVQTYSPQNCQE